jgi:HD-GYP domain-containing protein (c-di-GMP phosphodiesterase class II)
MTQTNDEEKLIRVPITQMVKFADSFAGAELHLSVGGKYVRLNYSTDEFLDILRKLQQKEVDSVFLRQTESKRIMKEIQESLSAKQFYDPKTVTEEKVETLDQSMATVKNIINKLGVDTETVTLLRLVNVRAMALLQESPTLFAFIKRFKKNCSDEFLRAMLTSYVSALIVDKFPWKSDSVKEKGAMASLLCDIMLEKEDFAILHRYEKEGGDLPEHIRNHPTDLAEKLRMKRDLIPTETITIIEQHHELPDGSGFPLGTNASRINQLSAIFIVSHHFIQELFEADFDYEKRFDITAKLAKKFEAKNFEKVIDALTQVVT